MNNKTFKKFGVLLALVAFLSVSLTSCHRYGCPNQISKADIELEENC